MTFLKTKCIVFIILAILFSGCSKYDYSIHKPKVRYKPSINALNKLNNQALGRKYIWAEEGPYCYDCSGLTYYNFGTMGIEIPRVADAQFRNGTPIPKSQLQKGDLVFFGNGSRATHVGIYLGNGKFEHASSAKKRVIISSLNNSYFRRHYMGARRYHNFDNIPQFKPQIEQQVAVRKEIPSQTFTNITTQTKQPMPMQTISNKPDGSYYILAGSFSNYPSALITKLELSGMPVITKKQNGYYKVLIGPYNSASEAKQNIGYNYTLLSNANIIKG